MNSPHDLRLTPDSFYSFYFTGASAIIASTMRKKITFAFGFLGLLLIAISAYLSYNLSVLDHMNRQIADVHFEAAGIERQIRQLHEQMALLEEKYISVGSYGQPATFARLTQQFGSIDAKLSLLAPLLRSQEEARALKRVRALAAAYGGGILPPEQLPPENEREPLLRERLAASEALRGSLSDLAAATEAAIQSAVTRSGATSRRALRLSLAFSGLAVLIGIALGFFIVRSILRPLSALRQATGRIAMRDFAYRIPVRGNDELAELARAFNRMAARLSDLDRLNREFIHKSSHELKATLSSIEEALRVVLDEVFGRLAPNQRRLLEIALRNCSRLRLMISDLLDIHKIQAGVMEFKMEDEDIIKTINSSIQEIEPFAREKGIDIWFERQEQEIKLSFDSLRIGQVMNNLLTNAIKYTPDGGSITVRVERVRDPRRFIPEQLKAALSSDSNEGVLVSVADTGIGIPPAELERVFEPFYQVKRDNMWQSQGSGLGLAIAKNIVEAHDGVIWAESKAGSCLRFVLPIRSGRAVKIFPVHARENLPTHIMARSD